MVSSEKEAAMAIRKLLLPLRCPSRGRSALAVAIQAAARWEAQILAVHIRTDSSDIAPLAAEGLSGAMVQDMIEAVETEARERGVAIQAMIDAVTRDRHPPVSIRLEERTGQEEDIVAWQARVADLTVIARPSGDDDLSSTEALHAVLFDGGRPLLMAPDQPGDTLGNRVCIAWNGTVESASAVRAALSWAQKAEAVCILTAHSYYRQGPAAKELVEYLGCHGIRADIAHFNPVDGSVGAGLLQAAEDFSCDLLAMGAYSHSRLRQMILGGVTRHVMEHARIPVLMKR
ncbi:Universal stress protein family [Granulibacter bethesdensis CGDNIH1]|uniref:Universal stress protein family n=2 Tax=Granulibacter bethesdensis TaxID=364410 RepID=Q0BQ13_GRABC|nr:Universal stress protein family [Granulibacter bethesdensis CGDNIH1]APH52965.1 Universal stress protein family [Granulibacter bethesdensis]APH65653.1 Universal stress protein family [Granulibacter bethesdensis]